jgi:hypothetical protein
MELIDLLPFRRYRAERVRKIPDEFGAPRKFGF